MEYEIKNRLFLKKILWLDALMGGCTAIIGLIFFTLLANLLGLTANLIQLISIVTLVYAVLAFILANQKSISIPFLRVLVNANWVWTIVSLILFITHLSTAKILGIVFLILQIFVVGGLAYIEGKQILKKERTDVL